MNAQSSIKTSKALGDIDNNDYLCIVDIREYQSGNHWILTFVSILYIYYKPLVTL